MRARHASLALFVIVAACRAKAGDALVPLGTFPVRGIVADSTYGSPFRGALVRASRRRDRQCERVTDHAGRTDSLGAFILQLPSGRHYICAAVIGYVSQTFFITLPADSGRLLDFRLPPIPIKLAPM
jgi:hypothetical protein